jgi:hypothetical protein
MLVVDVATMLAAAGLVRLGELGAGPLPPLFVGRVPEAPDRLVVLTEYSGRPPEDGHAGDTRRFPRVQCIVRDRDPIAARTLIEQVWRLLHGTRALDRAALTVNGTEYEVIVPLSEAFPLPADSGGRSLMACNFEARWDL